MDHGLPAPACARRASITHLMTHAAVACSVCSASAHAGDIWADRVVYGVHEGHAVYESGVGSPLTFGPVSTNPLWDDPESLPGPPNTLDYDDLTGSGPVPGGFAGGPMRRVHLAWPAWQWGSGDPEHLGQRPGWLDGRRQNGLGLRAGGQAVVEFDDPVVNNPDDGGAYHWGADLIVHGNAYFAADTGIAADANLNAVTLSGAVFEEPITVAVAQSAAGPWYTSGRAADGLFPTQPWAWDRSNAVWTGAAQDWGKPVDPRLSASDFAGISAADAIGLYNGSAGGTAIDLDSLIGPDGEAVSLPWVRFVRFTDPTGTRGEICAVADVPPGLGCTSADLAEPFGVLDLADIGAFVSGFTTGAGLADLAVPFGVLDLADIGAFVGGFSGGCP